MSAIAHGHAPPSPAPFAPGRLTSELAATDAGKIRDVARHSSGVVSSLDLDYVELNSTWPIFALRGGGGFTLFATQRDETLHPQQGKSFVQDQARRNWGLDLAPGQYQVIIAHRIVMDAVRIPAGGAPIEVLGMGGGIYAEG
jgi:hypothetical protein